jgi:alkylated DNA nucleotide flippase Atl1/ribosomal protein S18 acetylase RimI-like enzyme
MRVEIRPYRDEDLPSVIELWQGAFPDAPPWNEPAADIARKLEVQPELFVVATDGGEIVGTAVAGYDGHRGWVYYVAVGPGHRRRGIGTALMRRVERELAGVGCPKLNLQVRGANREAVRFYESLGYVAEDRVSMGRRLEEPKMPERSPGGPVRSTGIHERIHRIARLIPSGRVATYGQIAAFAGGCTPRMVGYAMASIPPGSDVPWHRVINSKGTISLRAGSDGHEVQRGMLESEGVVFDERGRVDLERFAWTGPGLKQG